MKSAARSAAVSIALASVSCGRMQLDSSAASAGVDSAIPRNDHASDAGSGSSGEKIACETPQRDTELWRHGLWKLAATAHMSVAADREGNAFAASAPGGTVKLDASGKVLWSKPFGELVATGRTANLFVAGTFAETVDLDECNLVAEGPTEAYVAELSPGGRVLRCTGLGGAEGVTGLAVDVGGNAVVSGPVLGTVKVDRRGRVSWRRELSGSIATDSRGNVFVTGALTGSKVFDDQVLESAGGEDVLLAKLDPQGSFVFARRFGDASAVQHAEGIAIDRSGDVLVSGVAEGSVDFGGGVIAAASNSCPAETSCKQLGFIVKFDSSGTHLWSRSRLPARSLPGIAADSNDNVIVSGSYPGSAPPYRLPLLVEFDPAGETVKRTIRTASALTDAGAGLGVAFDPCGNALWALTAPPVPSMTAPSFLAKLSP